MRTPGFGTGRGRLEPRNPGQDPIRVDITLDFRVRIRLPTEGGDDLALEREHVLAHERARPLRVPIGQRAQQLGLVVDRVAQPGTRSSTTYQILSESEK